MWKQVGIIPCPYLEISLLPSELESKAGLNKAESLWGAARELSAI